MEMLVARQVMHDNTPKDLYLELSTHKQKGAGSYAIASTHYKSIGNGYAMRCFTMFEDFNRRIDESIVRTGRVTDKTLAKSLELAKAQLPSIIQRMKDHYQAKGKAIDWVV